MQRRLSRGLADDVERLVQELLFGKLVNGVEVKVRIKDNAPAFEITPAAPKPSKARPKKPPVKKKAGGEAPAAE
jgi:ATP-dependent Clp protease ATP-binding subunit ClpA